MTSRRSSGSRRAESAVKPTRSENINGYLAALGGVTRCSDWCYLQSSRFLSCFAVGQLGDRAQHFAAVTKRFDPDLLEILIGQLNENCEINIVFSKALRVLGHAELFKPVQYFFGYLSAHNDNSSSNFFGLFHIPYVKPSAYQP